MSNKSFTIYLITKIGPHQTLMTEMFSKMHRTFNKLSIFILQEEQLHNVINHCLYSMMIVMTQCLIEIILPKMHRRETQRNR